MACVEIGNTCFTAGETITIDWAYTDINGAAIDMTGQTVTMQLLSSLKSVSEFIDMTANHDLPNGTGNFSLTATQSQTLLPLPITGDEPVEAAYIGQIKVVDGVEVDFIAQLNVSIEQNAAR